MHDLLRTVVIDLRHDVVLTADTLSNGIDKLELVAFTLQALLDEIARWIEDGISLFQAELDDIKLAHPPPAA